MREALARSDFDAVRRSPAPARPRRPAGARASGRARTTATSGAGAMVIRLATAGFALIGGLLLAVAQLAFRALERWPVSVVGGLLTVSLSAAIIVNAVSLQEGPHPSPLFGDPPAAAAPARSEPPPPPRRSGDLAMAGEAPAGALTAPAPPRKAPVQPAPAQPAPAKVNDPIAHLLATGAPPAAKPAATGVLAVQKALVKLGYDISADGLNGPATREAISAFEKLEGLPVTGDPANAATRRALSVATGLTLD